MKSIDKIVNDLSQRLLKQQKTLVTAESCTGGGVSFILTAVSGSSDWFERGFVTYSNAAKAQMLGVSPQCIEEYGAVSEEVANAMAEGALKHSEADVSLSITGIAGPTGGTPEKPVGTVCFGWSSNTFSTITQTQHFSGNREEVRNAAILFSLSQLLKYL